MRASALHHALLAMAGLGLAAAIPTVAHANAEIIIVNVDGPGEGFKSALVAFDVKNGVKRAQASSDAQLQVDDYLAMSSEKYEAKAPKPKASPTPPPPVQAAAAPKQD